MFPCFPRIPLRKGCTIIGSIEVACAIFGGILYTLGLSAVGAYESLEEIKFSQEIFIIPFVNLQGESSVEDVGLTLQILFSLGLFGCLIYLMIAAVLIIAARRRESRLLITWMTCKFVCIISILVYLLVTSVLGYITIVSLIVDLLTTVIQIYFLWVVYHYNVQVRNENSFALSPSIRKSGENIEVHFPLGSFEKL